MRDDRIGYRDQRDADQQRGICPDCGTYIRNLLPGDGGRCPVCNPPVRTYTYACGASLTTDDDDYGCPEHGQDCRRVKTEILHPPRDDRSF